MRFLPRRVEGYIGGKLLQAMGRKFVKDAGLVLRQVKLPVADIPMNYYERNSPKEDDSSSAPTLLLCHGITDQAKSLAPFVVALIKTFPNWRILIPDQVGHGHDLERVRKVGIDNFAYPHAPDLLHILQEFLQVVKVQPPCHAFGMSMGAAVVYFLQEQQPDLMRTCILINPALECMVRQDFIDDFMSGRKNHFCVTSREDIKHFFRDLSCPHRKVQNPVPKFLLQAIWEDVQQTVPEGHFRKYFLRLLEARGKDPAWHGCSTDIAPDAHRLVIWPEHDFITHYDQGKAFFEQSPNTIFHRVPDCGHLFHSHGKTIVEHTTPVMVEYLLSASDKEIAVKDGECSRTY